MRLGNLNSNSADRTLNIAEQNTLRGGYNYYSGGAMSSYIDIYSLDLRRAFVTDSGTKFDLTLVFDRNNVNVNRDPKSQIITVGDAKVTINGKEV